MNVFLDLLKKNKILPDLNFSRDSIAKSLIGTPPVSPVPQTAIEKAVEVAKTLGAYTAAQVATDIPKAFTGAVNISPPVDLVKRIQGSYIPEEQFNYAKDALAPIGYLSNIPLALAAGGGNIAVQQALSMLQGSKSPNYGESFANGINASGPALALGPLLKAFASKPPNTTRYVGDPLPPDHTKWIQKGERLVRDMRYGPKMKYAGK